MTEAFDNEDPSFVFGQEQGLFAYNMASSLTAHSDRPVIERADDAVRTAIRQFDRPDVDTEMAVQGLMRALQEDLSATA